MLAIKAGHNQENYNHNDVGSFVLHVDGENLLAMPAAEAIETSVHMELVSKPMLHQK